MLLAFCLQCTRKSRLSTMYSGEVAKPAKLVGGLSNFVAKTGTKE